MAEKKDLTAVVEQINRTFDELRTANDARLTEIEKRGEATAETNAKVDKINADLTELRTTMNTLERQIAHANLPAGESRETTEDMEKRHDLFLRGIRHDDFSEYRTLDGSTDADGGILIPPSFEQGILMQAYDEADVRGVCQVGPTGRDLVIFSSMQKPSVAWGSGNISKQTSKTGAERMGIFDLRALITISNNTLEDAEANIVAELTMAFGQALAEAEDDAFVVGTGVEQPHGIMTDADILARFVKTGVAAAISDANNNGIDPLIEALYKLKKVYRRRATFAFNSTTEGAVRKLKDSDGQYLWQPPVQAGAPATLLGKPIINPEGMDDIGANKYPMLVGDFTQYKIRDRAGMSVQRLSERYADDDETGFIIKKRLGGKPVQYEAFTPIKCSA